jgi:outer membrane protein TolC
MCRQSPLPLAVLAACFVVLAGCQPQQPFYFHEDPDLSHYKGVATEIEYPDVEPCTLPDVAGAIRPFSLENNKPQGVWDLKLEEAIRNALCNNKIMRTIGGQVQGPPDFLMRNPQAVPSIYDPALAESDPRAGVEAALSAFDTNFSTKLLWNKNDAPNKSLFFGTYVQQDDLATFQAQLQKTAATGGTWTIRHNVQYDYQRIPAISTNTITNWNVNLEAEMRQPLLRGAGVQFNRIAGPGGQPGVYNGVVLARINTDIALADFEASVRNLVSDVETTYWELYYNYRTLDAGIAGRDSALQTWRRTYALYKLGAKGGEAEQEAQARQNYFLFRSSVEQALNRLYDTESKLRYLMGIAATDGRLIRPIDEPTTARISFDWYETLAEGLARSVELRQQKWVIKRREMELIAAKNFLLPQLDAVGLYRWRGLGDDLIASSGGTSDISQPNSNAYQSMTSGQFQEWQFGLELNMPIGFRREMTGVRNAQLWLAKERAKLQEQELELSHQLAYAIRQMETYQVLSQTNFNRRIAAQRQVDAVAAAYETGTVTIDRVLQAQRDLAVAESDYYRSVIDYNEAIMQVHYRKGSLLEYNGVYLAEGPWPGKAYFDARGRARARDASIYMDYGFTQPRVLSRGPYEQHANGSTGLLGSAAEHTKPSEADQPELVPTPEPQPIDPGYQAPETEPAIPAEPNMEGESRTSAWKGQAARLGSVATGAGWRSASKPAVQQASYQEIYSATAADSAQNGEINNSRSKSGESASLSDHESSANPSTVESYQPASGWKRISR